MGFLDRFLDRFFWVKTLAKQGDSVYNRFCHEFGGVAHLGERLNGIQEVRGSIPLISTTRKALETLCFKAFFVCSCDCRKNAES